MAKYKHRKKKNTGAKVVIIAAVAAVILIVAICAALGVGKDAPSDDVTDKGTVSAEKTEATTDTEEATEAPTDATEAPITEAPTEAVPDVTDYPGVGRTETAEPPATEPPVTNPPATDAPAPQDEPSGALEPSANGYAMLKKSVFIGDSICSGLRVFGVLPEENVCASGSVSACNMFWFGKFNVGGAEYGIEDAMRNWYIEPETIIFSMGMNDVNMGPESYFTDNYKTLIDTVRAVKPNAKMAVCSVTPVSAECSFAPNTKIDSYNAALKAFCDGYGVTYIDVSTLLKDANNDLVATYHSGDGIHLRPESYKIMLYSVCKTLGWQ